MKSLRHAQHLAVALATLFAAATAQIPNAGFESWSTGSPVGWTTSNSDPILPITQSSDAHSGSSSIQGTNVSVLTVVIPPSAYAEFPVSGRYSSLTGWYKFSPLGTDTLRVHCIVYKSGTPIGYSMFGARGAVSAWTQFNSPMTYLLPGVPDSAYIEFAIHASGSGGTAGSTFKLDDLAFGAATDVPSVALDVPVAFTLMQNYPNPFNPATNFEFAISNFAIVRLSIFDVLGREVAVLVNGVMPAGLHQASFNAQGLASGVYLYQLRAGSQTLTRRMLLLR